MKKLVRINCEDFSTPDVVSVEWEGEGDDELGLVQALSDTFVAMSGEKRSDGHGRMVNPYFSRAWCPTLKRSLSSPTVEELCKALADGEKTFVLGDEYDCGMFHETILAIV